MESAEIGDYERTLWPGEARWVQLHPHLKTRGYLLRRRYQPDWHPAKKIDEDDECNVNNSAENGMDVVRASDGQHMFLKRIESSTSELASQETLASSPHSLNHVPKILDTILLPDTDEEVLFAMPILRSIEVPWFENGYELMDCILQVTQALAAVHAERVTHGDLVVRNVGMLADNMYYKGWHVFEDYSYHPGDITKSTSLLKTAPYIPRCLAPIRYVLMDFGNSHYFPGDKPPLDFRKHGSYFPPEMNGKELFDCYKVDVWCFGMFIKELLTASQSFMKLPAVDNVLLYPQVAPWINKMLREIPEERPTIHESLDELREILKIMTHESLRQPVWPKMSWGYGETLRAVQAILRGHGDEEILFAQLCNTKPRREQLNFAGGSMKDRVELLGRVYRFLKNKGQSGGTMNWISARREIKN